MEKELKEFTLIDKKTLAETLNFMGFRYYIYDKENGRKVYSFRKTEKFNFALHRVLELRKEIDNY